MIDKIEVEQLKIIGLTEPLKGEVAVSGAKNAALPILMATLLVNDEVVLHRVPALQDVTIALSLLAELGVKIVRSGNSITLNAHELTASQAPTELVRKMRASILALGPLLGRLCRAELALPGGCAIGARPIDQHLLGMQKLGAKIVLTESEIMAEAASGLHGAEIMPQVVTVTGTENILMAAVLAKGTTVIHNAACEPEVADLANFLNQLGAKISGIGTSTLVVEGVRKLHGGSYTIMPDRIEAGTYLVAAAITRGEVILRGIESSILTAVTDKLIAVGAELKAQQDTLTLTMKGKRPRAISVSTAPYPGFPTDMQAQFMALAAVSVGTSMIAENIFENRFRHVAELEQLGARIDVSGRIATVEGCERLKGATLTATDLRASAGLVLAALEAEGVTTIQQISYLDRGYERLEDKLRALGANIWREKE